MVEMRFCEKRVGRTSQLNICTAMFPGSRPSACIFGVVGRREVLGAVHVAVLRGTLRGCFGVPKTAGRAQPKMAARTATQAVIL